MADAAGREGFERTSDGTRRAGTGNENWCLINTWVNVDPTCSDEEWKWALEWAILERFAIDNAAWIARKVDSQTLDRFPRSAHYEIYHGVVPRLERLPRYEFYKKRLVSMSENHFALTRYGYTSLRAAPVDDMKAFLRGKVNVYNDVHNMAVRATDEAFAYCGPVWAGRCQSAVDKYGDVFTKVFGESEPYYGEVADPWGDGLK